MFWIGIFFYFANRHLFNLQKYFFIILVLVGLEVVLAFIQYGLPQTHFLNKYAHEAVENIAIVGDRVRVTGTFSYLSGYTAFLLFFPFFVWALIFQRAATWLVFTLAIAGLVAAFMTGSRSGALLYLILIAFALLENYRIADILPVLGKIILPLLVIIGIFLVMKGDEVGRQVVTAYENFSYRVLELRERGEEADRLTWDFRYFTGGRFKYPVFGIGTGSTYQGAIILFGGSKYAREFGYVESEFVKVVLEGGWVLLFLKFLIAGLAIRQLCFGSSLFKFTLWGMLVYAAPIVFNVHNASFLLLGLILVDNINWQRQQGDKILFDRHKQAKETPPLEETTLHKVPDFGYPQVFR
jgi:hypothetical protein